MKKAAASYPPKYPYLIDFLYERRDGLDQYTPLDFKIGGGAHSDLSSAELSALFLKLLEALEKTIWLDNQAEINLNQLSKQVPNKAKYKFRQKNAQAVYTSLQAEWTEMQQNGGHWAFLYPQNPTVENFADENVKFAQIYKAAENNTDTITMVHDCEQSKNQVSEDNFITAGKLISEPMAFKINQATLPSSQIELIKKLIRVIENIPDSVKTDDVYKTLCNIFINKKNIIQHSKSVVGVSSIKFGRKTIHNVFMIDLNRGDRLLIHTVDGELTLTFMTAREYHDKRSF